ncbi:phenylalanine--tRNA ligase subunit alpha [Cryomorpha ignava]|uniref:Phenylalanine--tRNA ligase alpha subunit n=1 Tax=Cryomorpha ignava TaxID=101383 RepID=A0A7K3WUC8_9FLAO|nr:phenylalanine--tRNA ligase subunit alpha [Cryomorpha ignava]NEN25277.1 phenylalanine--tRNA ligase subunit alpha [Cryomorpha ignava]
MAATHEEIENEIKSFNASSADELEAFRVKYLGKKGVIKEMSARMKDVAPEDRKDFGQSLNALKDAVQERIDSLKEAIESQSGTESNEDLTRPSGLEQAGSRHPVTLVRNEIETIFQNIGFSIAEGPEIEDDWHNFSALNFPEEHPARDMQDTFFIEKDPDIALRTHTSSVQVRIMETQKPPIRIIAPGRVYRNEDISSRSHCIFHQVEGLYIDKGVSFADMKQTIEYFAKAFFGKTKIRLRPSYFPFTEPSAEVDVYWGLENEIDHRITKGTGWLEIMGCGMVDPNVLKASGIDPDIYSGFAFGMGIERIAMNRFQIGDIRMLFENDIRFLKQFQGAW